MHFREVRQALRLVRQQPVFSAAVILMLALGIGATTAIFTVVRGVLLRPLALNDPDRIVEVYAAIPHRGIDRMVFAEGNTWDIRDWNTVFSHVGISHGVAYSITGGGEPDRVGGSFVNAGFFDAMGIVPIAGRVFQPGDDEPGASAERVVISEPFWVSRFARSPNIVGQSIMLDGRSYEVIGVVAQESATQNGDNIYVPFIRRPNPNRGSWEYTVVGRLKPGVTMAAVETDLKRVAGLLHAHKENEGMEVRVLPSSEWVASPELRQALWLMLGAVGLLLLIGCVNVANLLLVRAASRTRERAVRTALGAGRGDLIREGLTESLVLAAIGGGVGVFVSMGLLAAFKSWDPGGVIPRLSEVRMDPIVWSVAAALSLAVGVITGLVPAWRSTLLQIVPALRDGQRGLIGDRQHDRTRATFVVVEVALSVLLLVGAGLLTRSLINVLTADRGFATERRITAEITMPGASKPEIREQMAERILASVAALPDVVSVGSVSGRMLVGGGTGMQFAGADRPIESSAVPWATWRNVTKDYFRAIGLRLMRGRGFTEQDLIGNPWRVVISDSLARRIWGDENPVGKTAILWKGQGERRGEVIGVVSDMREHRLDDMPTMTVYIPAYGGTLARTTLSLVIETKGDPRAVVPGLRAAVTAIDPLLPVSRIRSLEEMVSRSVASRRFTMLLIAAFATLASVLALAGVAGVLLYTMAKRTGEMGLRLALGAEPGALMRRALAQGLRPVVIGLVAGTAAAFWLSQVTASLLYGVTATDPVTFITAVGGLLLAAALACYGPARRALRIDPAAALRE